MRSERRLTGRSIALGLTIGSCMLVVWLALATAAFAAPPLAFVRDGDIWTVAANGSGLERLTSDRSYDFGPAWSPGRGTIAFIRRPSADRSGGARVWSMRSDGNEAHRLTYSGPSLTSGADVLACSPNGRLLAGGSQLRAGAKYAVTVLDLKTGKSRIVCRYSCQNGSQSLTWSPDGKQLVATIEYGGAYGMLRIDVARSRLIRNYGANMVESASWRPDGKYLLCSRWVPTASASRFRTLLMNLDGSRVKVLGKNQRLPVYAPDGSQYVFLRSRSNGACDLLRAAADGSGVTTIVESVDFSIAAWK